MYKKVLACVFLTFGSVSLYWGAILPDPVREIFMLLGLISIPLFTYGLVNGFLRTRDSGMYFLRLSVVASLTQTLLYIFKSRSETADPLYNETSRIGNDLLFSPAGTAGPGFLLNPLYILLIGFGLIYGLEILIPCGPRRIASMRLLEANLRTKSDRFDVRVSSGDMVEWPDGLKVPKWPIASLQLFGISLVVFCLAIPIFLPIEHGLFGVLLVAIFYAIEKVVSGRKAIAAFFCMLMLIAAYTFLRFRMTGELDPIGVSIASVFICYLPEKNVRPKRMIRNAFYIYFPVHILVLLLLRVFLFKV